jgi:3-oxoacyl-[acyl-carrier protein] reductase
MVIIGAAGGIGAASAARFAREGARLVLVDANAARLEAMAPPPGAAEVIRHAADVTDEAAVAALAAAVGERFGRVDVLVNGAGIIASTPFEAITPAEWRRMVAVNLDAVFLGCRAFLPLLRATGHGRIINFTSLAAQVGGIMAGAHYAAAKAGVMSLTKSLAKYLAADGVRVNAIAPGAVDTELLHAFTPEQREILRENVPVKRFASPEEAAELVAYLASPAADYITGQTINLNGGVYLG